MREGIDLSQRALQELDQNKQESQGTVTSSMETVPADFVDGSFSEPEQEELEIWARLFPVSASFDSCGEHLVNKLWSAPNVSMDCSSSIGNSTLVLVCLFLSMIAIRCHVNS